MNLELIVRALRASMKYVAGLPLTRQVLDTFHVLPQLRSRAAFFSRCGGLFLE
jgi:hypothetical protein